MSFRARIYVVVTASETTVSSSCPDTLQTQPGSGGCLLSVVVVMNKRFKASRIWERDHSHHTDVILSSCPLELFSHWTLTQWHRLWLAANTVFKPEEDFERFYCRAYLSLTISGGMKYFGSFKIPHEHFFLSRQPKLHFPSKYTFSCTNSTIQQCHWEVSNFGLEEKIPSGWTHLAPSSGHIAWLLTATIASGCFLLAICMF